ncbi:MAG TPA: translation initiation factor IF-2, partial [Chitinophagaceae bacterium]
QQEFQSDKAAKLKSDLVDLPKGAVAEAKKKKDEEEVLFKKEEKKPAKKEEPKEEVAPAPVKQEVVAPVIEEKEIIKVEAPEIEGPKILDKIDLSSIDSSTRPKKEIKKKIEKEETVEKEKPAAKKKDKEKTEEEKPVEIKQPEEPVVAKQEEEAPQIENIKAEKIEGPKILGKIDLPVDSDTRPKKEEKRKRKRIPIEKKEVKKEDLFKDRRDGNNRGPGHFNRDNRQGDRRGPSNRRDNTRRREDKEIDQKEIQEKIRETQAKLSGGAGRGKSLKARLRREKRQEMAEAMGDTTEDNKLQLTEFISVSELANLMDVNFADVISKCMSLGIMVSINQRLDAEVIELVASEFGYDVEFIDMEKQMEMEEVEDGDDDESELQPRSPIVTIMGHVDHGKTSLLDYIRNANVVAGEAGGITQHIGAYQVELPNGKEITFLDTPGHEAFTAMRARGAKITDIAVIVIAADDAVMPQTREAISHAQAAGVPMIFAVNKIDKDGANPQKIYEQLSQMNLLVEEWGGKYQSQEISAKKGLNVEQLLEKILLEAELLELKSNPDREANGSIIEASLDKGRGYVATLLVQNGTLNVGDIVVSGQHFGRVKAMFNERNKKMDEAGPSAPALILGLNGAPQAGE